MNIWKISKIVVLIILILFIILIALGAIINYMFVHTKPIVPKRPENVPVNAIWSGCPDGGNWFLCSKINNKSNRYFCKIYNDFNGDLQTKGEFALFKYTWDEKKRMNIYSTLVKMPSHLDFSRVGPIKRSESDKTM